MPGRQTSSALAAARERSMIRPGTNGPRSLIRTIVSLCELRSVTRTRVLSGSVQWAAVSAVYSYGLPLAVFLGAETRVPAWIPCRGHHRTAGGLRSTGAGGLLSMRGGSELIGGGGGSLASLCFLPHPTSKDTRISTSWQEPFERVSTFRRSSFAVTPGHNQLASQPPALENSTLPAGVQFACRG